jgi:CRP/FNR family transcriptional regulator, cyclic AMP receptor protein
MIAGSAPETDSGADATSGARTFWSMLGPADAGALIARARPRAFARGHALCHEGQVPDSVLLLRSGRVKVYATVSSGREVVLAFRGPGDLVGDLSALDGQPRSATMIAVDRVEAFALTHGEFRSFLTEHPHAALALLHVLSERLRDADAKRLEFSVFTTAGRVAARLIELCDRFGTELENGTILIGLPLSQEELAGATGASIESVGRALQTMRSLRYIETRRREIRVLDPGALKALRDAAG